MSFSFLYRRPLLNTISITRTILPRLYSTSSSQRIPISKRIKNGVTFAMSGTLIVGAVGLSTMVIYLIGSELFSPDADTALFNRAVSLCENDPIVHKLLHSKNINIKNKSNNNKNGSGDTELEFEKLKAFGELATSDKWTRNRPLVFQRAKDINGNLHCKLRFHLQSTEKIGLVHAEAVQYNHPVTTDDRNEDKKWYMRWKYNKPIFTMMYIDVKGEGRHFIIKPKIQSSSSSSSNGKNSKSLPFLSWLGLTR